MEYEAITQFREAFKLAPDNLEVLLALGNDFYKKGIIDKALEHYEAILAQEPGNNEVLYRVGQIYQDKNLFGQAVNFLLRILETDPLHQDALELLTHIYEKQEDFTAQLGVMLKLEQKDPKRVDWLLSIAHCYSRLLNYGKTEEYCLKIFRIEPDHLLALPLICQIYLKQQNWKAAQRYLEKHLVIKPKDVQIYLDLYQSHFELNQMEKAGKYIVQALALEDRNIDVLQTALSYYREIQNLQRQTEICNALLALKPDDYEFKRQMSQLLLEQEMYKEAGDLLRDLLMITPHESDLLVQQAKILTLQGLPSKAVLQLQQVLANEPNHAMAHFELGRTYHTQKEWNKAVLEFKKAVNLGIKDARAHAELGAIYLSRGFFDNALESYQMALQLEPENISNNLQIAEIYFKLNRPQKALMEYESLLQKQPSNIKLNVRLAQVYQTQKMFDEAIALLDKLLVENPDNTQILFELGRTWLYRKDKNKARDFFQKTLSADAKHAPAQVELAVLDSTRDPQEAIRVLKRMIQQSPTPDSFFYLSRIYIDNNMIDQAIAEFKVFTKTYPDAAPAYAELGKLYTTLSRAFNNDSKMRESALESLNKAVLLDDSYSRAYFYLAENYHLADNLEATLINLRKAYQIDPQNLEIREFLTSVESQKTSIEIKAKLEEAKTFLQRGMDQNAIIEYDYILELDPFHDEANHDLARIYLKQDNLELAKRYFRASVERNHSYIRSYFELAKIHLREVNLNEAEVEMTKVLALEPRNFEANLLMGQILTQAAEYMEATIYFQKASEINPSSPRPFFELGKMFLAMGETEQTKVLFEKVFKLDPGNHEVNEFFVRQNIEETERKIQDLLTNAHQAEEARETLVAKTYYEDVLTIQPGHLFARYKAGVLNEVLGRPSDAIFDYQQAYGQLQTFEGEYVQLPHRLGMLLAKMGRTDEAVPVLIRALELDEFDIDLNLTLLEQYKSLFGSLKYEQYEGNTPEQIILRYEEKAAKNQQKVTPWLSLGYLYRINLACKDEIISGFQKGIEAYTRAHSLDRKNLHVLFHLGILNHFTGKIAKAKEFLKLVLQEDPANIKAKERLIRIHMEAKEFDDAGKLCRELIAMQPENGHHRVTLIELLKVAYENEAKRDEIYERYRQDFATHLRKNLQDPMAHFDYGFACITMTAGLSLSDEDVSMAVSEFKQCVSLAPNNPWGYWGLKRVYNKQSITGTHRYQEAIDICRRALEKCGESAQAFCELGNALNEDYETNRKGEAIETYKKALQFEPEYIEVYFKMASIFRIRNQYADAEDYYRRVIELDPTHPYSKDAKRSLIHIDKSRKE
jgi:tetratricopeptide (TPR) repeat protein